jgi:SAM-dependent MidA family methyltransferase
VNACKSLREEHHVALQRNQVLAAVDDQRGAGNGAGASEITDRRGDILGRAGFAEGRDAMGIGEAGRALLARLHCDAGRHADHAQLRRQRLRQHRGRALQRGFRQGVGQEIRVQVEQFLIQQIDHHRLRTIGRCGMQRLRQQQRRGQVDAHVRIQRGGAEGGGAVLLEQRGVVDDAADRSQGSRTAQQVGNGIGVRIGQIALQRQRAPSQAQGFDFGGGGLRFPFGRMVVQRDVPALPRQGERDHAADALGGAGHQGNAGSPGLGYDFFWIGNHGFQYNTAMQLQLPAPSGDALAASASLQRLIADEIRQRQGWISFARYMELVLYAPHFGYYSGGAAKLGKEGDFTTAPELSPLFGATLAALAAEMFAQTAPAILEFGAGSGKLAHDILTELAAAGVALERYLIVEVSPQLRARQQEALAAFPNVQWLDRWPAHFSGVAIGNEVLDAMPVSLVVKRAEGWCERGVTWEENESGVGAFVFEDRACDAALAAQIPDADALPAGYLTEVHPTAAAFMRSLAAMLCGTGGGDDGEDSGAQPGGALALLIDYGFPGHEYYLGQRSQGTLMCHYRHHAHPDPFYLPGLQDVTAHVDFTAMAQAAVDGGLDLLGYTSQAGFLLGAGIGDLLLRTSPDQPAQYLPQANAVQKLISPAEMGELFKVLALGHRVEWPDRLLQHDRSHRL